MRRPRNGFRLPLRHRTVVQPVAVAPHLRNSAISAPFAFASRQTARPFCRFSSRESPGAICSSASFKRFILNPTFLFISRIFLLFQYNRTPGGQQCLRKSGKDEGSIGSNIKKGMERFHPFLIKLIVMPAHGLGEFQNRHGQQRQSEADQIQPILGMRPARTPSAPAARTAPVPSATG